MVPLNSEKVISSRRAERKDSSVEPLKPGKNGILLASRCEDYRRSSGVEWLLRTRPCGADGAAPLASAATREDFASANARAIPSFTTGATSVRTSRARRCSGVEVTTMGARGPAGEPRAIRRRSVGGRFFSRGIGHGKVDRRVQNCLARPFSIRPNP